MSVESHISTLYDRRGGEEAVLASLRALNVLATSGEIRDYSWESDGGRTVIGGLFHSLQLLWSFPSSASIGAEEAWALSAWMKLSVLPEYSPIITSQQMEKDLDDAFISLVIDRLVHLTQLSKSGGVLAPDTAVGILQHLFISLYNALPSLRPAAESHLAKSLLAISKGGKVAAQDGGHERIHVSALLQILHCLLRGSACQQSHILANIWHRVLLPLHSPNEMIAWRDQVPILQSYHEDLVRCTFACLENGSRDLTFSEVLRGVISSWPEGFSTNTPKQVLLLHEVELLLARCSVQEFAAIEDLFMRRFLKCIGGEAENIRPAQRALQFFKVPAILQLFIDYHKQYRERNIISQMVEALYYRSGALSWNPTVNKMTALALKAIKDGDEGLYREAATTVITTSHRSLSSASSASTSPRGGSGEGMSASRGAAPLPMKPPTMQPKLRPSSVASLSSSMSGFSRDRPPPVTITGVAPWAVAAPAPGLPSGSAALPSSRGLCAVSINKVPGGRLTTSTIALAQQQSGNHLPPNAIRHTVQEDAKLRQQQDLDAKDEQNVLAFDDPVKVLEQYMEKCYPSVFSPQEDPSHAHNKVWNLSQAAASPTLLPGLKFHDLVFGPTLGEGAFSTVRYARLIERSSSQTSWPEFAVKIVSGEQLERHQYGSLAMREVAVLRQCSHPNTARLISAFRYRDGIYMVLEYAKRGDLHSVLVQSGALSINLVRFVLGEICSALAYIHDQLGCVFNDLKPENVLITELGHIKLADFGAVRPRNADGRNLLLQSLAALQQEGMRSGDWKAREEDEKYHHAVTELVAQAETQVEDGRVEGTAAYMPPELFPYDHAGLEKEGEEHQQRVCVHRGAMDTASDSWALGCLAYFCSKGKPRFYGALDQLREQWDVFATEVAQQMPALAKSVHFTASPSMQADRVLDEACETLVSRLLSLDPRERPTANQLLADDFLLRGYYPSVQTPPLPLPPVFSPSQLYATSPPDWPETSAGGARSEERWARRQFSSLWAPMPGEYDLNNPSPFRGLSGGRAGSSDSGAEVIEDGQLMALVSRSLPILRGDESDNMSSEDQD